MTADNKADERSGLVPSEWSVNPSCRDEWLLLLPNGISLRVVHYDRMYYAYASDKARPKQPTLVFNKLGCKALPEAMRTAEVLGESLRTTMEALTKLAPNAQR